MKGVGMISGGSGSTVYYRIQGVAVGVGNWEKDFGEKVTGTMVFDKCTGRLKALNGVRAAFETVVDPKGGFQTKVWKRQ